MFYKSGKFLLLFVIKTIYCTIQFSGSGLLKPLYFPDRRIQLNPISIYLGSFQPYYI